MKQLLVATQRGLPSGLALARIRYVAEELKQDDIQEETAERDQTPTAVLMRMLGVRQRNALRKETGLRTPCTKN